MCVLTARRWVSQAVALVCVLMLLGGDALAQDGGAENLGVPRKRDVDSESRKNSDASGTEGSGENHKGDQADDEESVDLPDIRRRPPRTDEEEQRFKRFKFQTDPFLTVWDFSTKPDAYNPMDWLTFSSGLDSSLYMAQNSTGEVVGSLAIDVVKVSDNEHGEMFQITLNHRLERSRDTVLLVDSKTFAPIRFEEWDLGRKNSMMPGSSAGASGILHLNLPRFLAKYCFDRVDIEREKGEMISRARFRQLPYSFDKTSMVLVARNLNFRFPDWPFETPVTDPVQGAKIILSIPKPERGEVLSAEPKTYNCYELKLHFGGVEETWWVERIPPNRLVKFTKDGYTFTLSQYLEHL